MVKALACGVAREGDLRVHCAARKSHPCAQRIHEAYITNERLGEGGGCSFALGRAQYGRTNYASAFRRDSKRNASARPRLDWTIASDEGEGLHARAGMPTAWSVRLSVYSLAKVSELFSEGEQ